jgi:hypothetical protein
MDKQIAARVYVSIDVRDADDSRAIVLNIGEGQAYSMTIAMTRWISNLLAKAADEAEAKLPDEPARRIDDSIDDYLS